MLFIDIGSTFTKLVVFDTEKELLVGRAQAPTTIYTDVSIGFHQALARLEERFNPDSRHLKERYACSSAAGGLKLVAIGLVPDLTVEAARRAALGAGAKVVGAYGHQLSKGKVREIEELSPDIILLAGGTNGGDRETIIHNARMLAGSRLAEPIIVAGNEVVSDEVEDILKGASKETRVTENVMPEINKLRVEPARELIREVFLSRIIYAKGLDKIQAFIDSFLMPTPMAVLEAAKLLGEGGYSGQRQDVLVVDVGGATTDVHSVGEGLPHADSVIFKGLPEPYLKRTVEGDLGVRHNISSIVSIAGARRVVALSGLEDCEKAFSLLENAVNDWSGRVDFLPEKEEEKALDIGLAAAAVEVAVNRHAGRLETVYVISGQALLQYGKDLTEAHWVVGTGGPIASSKNPRLILQRALFDHHDPFRLKPKNPELYVDREYLMFAAGLMSEINPQKARSLLLKYLHKL